MCHHTEPEYLKFFTEKLWKQYEALNAAFLQEGFMSLLEGS
jgi:hypothetical protein